VDPQEGLRLLAETGPLAALALLPFAVMLTLDALGWRRLFTASTRAKVGFADAFVARTAAEAVGQSLPSAGVAGEAAAAWLLRVKTATPLGEAIGTLAARRILLALGHGLILAVAAVALAAAPPTAPRALGGLLVVSAVVMLGVALAGSTVLRHASPFARLHVVLRRLPWTGVRAWLGGRTVGLPRADQETSRVFRGADGPWTGAAVFYFALYLTETLETWLLLRLLGAEVPLVAVLAVEPLLSLLRAMVFFVPAGLGVQDLGYVAFLHASGVPEAAALGAAFVVLKRAKELAWVAAGWTILLAAGGRSSVAPPGGDLTGSLHARRTVVTARS
jgi:hypothetical protein